MVLLSEKTRTNPMSRRPCVVICDFAGGYCDACHEYIDNPSYVHVHDEEAHRCDFMCWLCWLDVAAAASVELTRRKAAAGSPSEST